MPESSRPTEAEVNPSKQRLLKNIETLISRQQIAAIDCYDGPFLQPNERKQLEAELAEMKSERSLFGRLRVRYNILRQNLHNLKNNIIFTIAPNTPFEFGDIKDARKTYIPTRQMIEERENRLTNPRMRVLFLDQKVDPKKTVLSTLQQNNAPIAWKKFSRRYLANMNRPNRGNLTDDQDTNGPALLLDLPMTKQITRLSPSDLPQQVSTQLLSLLTDPSASVNYTTFGRRYEIVGFGEKQTFEMIAEIGEHKREIPVKDQGPIFNLMEQHMTPQNK